MNKYESMFIMVPGLEEEKRKELIEKLKGIIVSSAGKLLSLDEWGARRLAYRVKGNTEGDYCLLHLEANPATIQELARNYRATEDIIKYLSVRIEEKKPKPAKPKPKRYRPGVSQKREYGHERRREKWQD